MDDDPGVKAEAALAQIAAAFAGRAPPAVLTDSMQLTDAEYEEVMAFDGLHWQDVTFEQVQRCPDAVFWFSPEAFCYYLPGILAAGLRESSCDSNAYDSIIGMLDRSPEPEFWDDFFAPRWPLLATHEIDAVAAWLEWLKIVQPDELFPNTYDRAEETLILLRLLAEEREAAV
jgi:hypothetical protein